MVEDREEDDEQFFFQIDLPLAIHNVDINRCIILNDCLSTTDGLRPIDLVEARMNVLQNKREIVLVLIVEPL